ncbi:hypothetical protein BDW75DRAFT_89687 [Aspergillus navahoensis]
MTAIAESHEPSLSNSVLASASARLEDGERISILRRCCRSRLRVGMSPWIFCLMRRRRMRARVRVLVMATLQLLKIRRPSLMFGRRTMSSRSGRDAGLSRWVGGAVVYGLALRRSSYILLADRTRAGPLLHDPDVIRAISYLLGSSESSRGFYGHNRLWQHCQHLVLRIVLGKEKLSKAKTRHIPTIEAFLLLSKWYPLAPHFPVKADGWGSDWVLTTITMRDPPLTAHECPMQDRWKEDVVEPTRRSDRMSWMLVSSALALAHELDPRDQLTMTK